MNKKEVHEAVSEDVRQYMVSAHFNLNNVKAALKQENDGVVSGDQAESLHHKAQREYEQVKNYGMNSFYNFYREGVLSKYVVKITEGADKQKMPDSYKMKFIAAFFTSFLAYGFYDSRRFKHAHIE